MADDLPDAPWVALPSAPWAKQDIGGGRAAFEGFKSGATAGLSDVLSSTPGGYASTEVEGIQFLTPEQHEQRIKAADEEFRKAYAGAKAMREAAQAQHPYLYGAGEAAGAVVPMLAAPGAQAASLPARMGQAARVGAGYGAVSGGVEGGREGPAGAAIGAVGGGLLGAGLGAASEPMLAGAKALASPITSRIGAAFRTLRDPEQEASRQLLQADTRDIGNIGKTWNPVTQTEQDVAAQTGLPLTAVDVGGPNTRALADWAAQTSPEAHAQFTQLNQRLQGARERVGQFIKDTVGGEDLDADRVAINAGARAVNRPAYKAAYEAGDRPIWSPELEQLVAAPAVKDAVVGAINKWRNFQVLDGYGAMNPPLRIDKDGFLTSVGGKNLPPYPNMQLWDYARRMLSMAAESAKGEFGKPTTESAMYSQLAHKLNAALDKEVPEYTNARAGAAQFFGAENALKAGAKFVSPQSSFNLGAARRSLAAMSDDERTLFARGYATQAAERVMSGGRGALNTLFGSPQARQRAEMALGPEKARQLEALLRVEEVVKSTQSIHGGSPTARRLAMQAAMGVGFGEGTEYLTHDWRAAGIGALAGAALSHGRVALNQRLAVQLAKMLTSDDPTIYNKGIELAARTPKALGWLRNVTLGEATHAAVPYAPQLQLPAPAAAENQQNVPGVVPQRKAGGRVDDQKKATKTEANYHGGTKDKRCGVCTMFRPPSSCTAVRGQISPHGWCKFFEHVPERADGGKITTKYDVVSGAVENTKTGEVEEDRHIPEGDRKHIAAHERAEAKAMARGVPYKRAHEKYGIPAERRSVERAGKNWREYSERIAGVLSHVEHEHVCRAPRHPHVDPREAVDARWTGGHIHRGDGGNVFDPAKSIMEHPVLQLDPLQDPALLRGVSMPSMPRMPEQVQEPVPLQGASMPNRMPQQVKSIMAYGKYLLDVYVNPSIQTIRSLAKEGPVRVHRDPENNIYAWDAGTATHEHVQQQLKYPVKDGDVLGMYKGRLVSGERLGTQNDFEGPYDSSDLRDAAKLAVDYFKP